MVLVFLVGRGSDAAQFAGRQKRFEDIAGIHGPAAGGAGTHDRVNFVDEQDGVFAFLQFVHHPLEALLEIAPEFRPGQHAAQVQRINPHLFEQVRDFAFPDLLGQAFRHGRFAHTRIAHENGVVFPAAAEHLHGAFHLQFPADQRIQLALGRPIDEVHRVGFQRAGFFLGGFLFGGRGRFRTLFRNVQGKFMGDHTQYIQPGNPLFVQEEYGVGVLFHEDGSQNVANGHLFFLGGTHMVDGPLDHPLKADGLLEYVFALFRKHLHVFIEEHFQVGFHVIRVSAAFFHDVKT